MPALLATWNRARDAWETSHSHIDLFSGLSAVWSEIFPTWGMWADGAAYARPTSAPLTDGSASSSPPGLLPTPSVADGTGGHLSRSGDRSAELLLPGVAKALAEGPLLRTPTAQLAVNGGSQHPEKRKAGGHGPTLADEVEHLLPTPAASVANDGEGTESWLARRERVKATAVNGNGMGMPLTIAVQLLPTPTAMDSRGSRQSTAPNPRADADTLTDWAWKREGWSGASTDRPSDDGNAA